MRSEHKSELKLRRRNIALTVAYDGTNYNGLAAAGRTGAAVVVVMICAACGGLSYAF